MLEDFSFASFKEKFKTEKRFRIIVISVGTLLVSALLLFGYYQFFYLPKEEASHEIYVEALNNSNDFNERNAILYQLDDFQMQLNEIKKDSVQLDSAKIDSLQQNISALSLRLEEKESNISKQIRKLESNIEEYEGYGGELAAKYVLGTYYMKDGQYQKALTLFEQLEVDDTFLSSMIPGLKGDCYSNLGDYSKAYNHYAIAYNTNFNDFTTPMYLWKAGLVAEKLNQFEEASYCFQKLKNEFPNSSFVRNNRIDFHIERAKNSMVQ